MTDQQQIARQQETAGRLRQLATMIYGKDKRAMPLLRVADFLDSARAVTTDADHADLPAETQFMLTLIVDLILNDRANAQPTPHAQLAPGLPDSERGS